MVTVALATLASAEPLAVQIGRSVVRREGTDVALLAYGTVTNDALKAADMLARSGVTATVVDMRCARSHNHHLRLAQGQDCRQVALLSAQPRSS
jgi:transketolase C-terminal domain/subunit